MRIRLHIERLVLDGVPAGQPQVLRRAIESELAHKLGETGLAQQFRAPVAIPRISGGHIQIGGNADTSRLGRQIADGVCRGIGGTR